MVKRLPSACHAFEHMPLDRHLGDLSLLHLIEELGIFHLRFDVAWRALNWLNTVISTNAITSQMAIFFIRLFKLAP